MKGQAMSIEEARRIVAYQAMPAANKIWEACPACGAPPCQSCVISASEHKVIEEEARRLAALTEEPKPWR